MIIINCSNELLMHHLPLWVGWIGLAFIFVVGCWLLWLDKSLKDKK